MSVVVATRDRPRDLVRCLKSVLAQDYAGNLEVIVVDQSVGPVSGAQVEALSPVVRYSHEATPGKARALNRALALAGGDILLLTDDDCTVRPGWVSAMTSRLTEDDGAAVVFGPVVAAAHDPTREYVPVFEPSREHRLSGRMGRLVCSGLGANMAVRRSVVEAIGGWDDHIGPGGRFRSGDDNDLAYRCLAAGNAAIIDLRSPVTHFGSRPYADGAVRRLHRNNFYGTGATLTKHIRCGDVIALCRFGWCLVETIALTADQLLRRRSLTGAGRLVALLDGARTALTHAIDRRTRRFVTTPERF